jgi:uncharacterized repeat protein (TIGR04052 family)
MRRHVIPLSFLFFLACGGHDHSAHQHDEPDMANPASADITLSFKGVVGSESFACGRSYAQSGTTLQAADFRLYISDVKLLNSAGGEEPVLLTADGKWQTDRVALIDFEDKTGDCTGTGEVNTQIRGRVNNPQTTWSGLRFTVGVPFVDNHQDRAAAAAPLNLSAMFWSWQSGYKFLRFEGKTSSSVPFVVHVGSTGCVKDVGGQVTSCSSPNRATITVNLTDPGSQTVVVDAAALLSGVNLANPAECHSESDKAECGSYFKALGLPFLGQSGTQSLFRVQ